MGLNLYDYHGFQPKKYLHKHMQHSVCTVKCLSLRLPISNFHVLIGQVFKIHISRNALAGVQQVLEPIDL